MSPRRATGAWPSGCLAVRRLCAGKLVQGQAAAAATGDVWMLSGETPARVAVKGRQAGFLSALGAEKLLIRPNDSPATALATACARIP